MNTGKSSSVTGKSLWPMSTFCSWLAMAGASIKEIQELAGHKTITMSARYSHLSPAHKLSVVDRITSAASTSSL